MKRNSLFCTLLSGKTKLGAVKKSFFVSVIISIGIIFPCCKKNNDSSFQSYIRMALNGTKVECNAHIQANPPFLGDTTDSFLNISGNWPADAIELEINEPPAATTTGSYTFEPGKWRSATVWIGNNPGYPYGAGGGGLDSNLYGSGRITILEISKDYVMGSFEFTTAIDPATHISQSATDGEFYIKRRIEFTIDFL